MSLFSGIETDEDQPGGGFLKRLRGIRPAAFVQSGGAATRAVQEPRFSDRTNAINPTVSFLGRKLSGDDITDVEEFTESDGSVTAVHVATATSESHNLVETREPVTSGTPTSLAESVATAPIPEPAAESATVDVTAALGDAYAKGEKALRELDAMIAAQSRPMERTHGTAAAHVAECAPPGAVAETVAIANENATTFSQQADAAPTPTHSTVPTSARLRTPAGARPQAVPPHSSAIRGNDEDDDQEPEPTSTTSGRPALVSAEALPDFKRVITGVEADSTLRISAAVRKEFVAVEIQPGIAIVAATARFSERAQFATFLKDLAAHDLLVQEEMIATEEVIASIYEGKRDVAVKGEREASRAIGNFRDIIEAAHAYGASDVHIEPRDFLGEVEVRFRVNGDLYTYRRLPKNIVRRALSAAYSDLVQKNTNSGNSFQPSAPQSAMIPLVLGRDTVNLRWQSAPTVGGYDVGLRLLDGNFKNYSVLMPDQMGLSPSQLALIDTLNYVSGGITVLTGETGSGKTTLLRALSYMLPDRELKKQFAVSEPSEYPLPWLSEISIIRRPDESDDEANRKYAEVIRTLMRLDPDDVTISEVRDRVVMGLVSELALTGHPVRLSLHAGDVISAVMRMAGGRLQLPIDELAAEGFINAVGNQKLVPTLCDDCKLSAEDVMHKSDLELLRSKFGLDTSKMACRNHAGCPTCRLEGLFSRDGKVAGGTRRPTLVAELYRPTPEFRERVAARDWSGARAVWRGERKTGFANEDMTGKTLYEHALFKASRGEIDPQFINRSMQSFAQYRVMPGADGKL
ncbi:ATPase, T2SS/T4P/T4SS family [Paraburkholderia diazotrophica]|uniref:Type II secretory pathway ATPase GspE/PulE or T4P pilus assembly pathway ATPase PilB n=1 Tax=Paraburkholderia diazotrophica TaxID=667676 RepID=A0A1H7E8P1_9BURK|nr:ATPase, T2SS/T4P/T4SS family [Paraburkholderia diazotrophica]SEK10259.1 Type II secretory pathway ATPase GspE/PulE or T4P pilus assembly pathway ATPase PilB [Paraburkholderia diazotrophica]